MKALIQSGKVVQVAEEPFEVHPSMVWVDIPDGLPVEYGWLWDKTKGFTASKKKDRKALLTRRLAGLLAHKLALVELGEGTAEIDAAVADVKAEIQGVE